MAKAANTVQPVEAENNVTEMQPRKRSFKKKLAMRAPTIDLEVGQSVEGILGLKKLDATTKYGAAIIVNIELLEDFTQTKPKRGRKGGTESTTYPAGEVVSMFVKAGARALVDLPEGTEFRMTCTGTVPSDKGNDAYTFEVEHN